MSTKRSTRRRFLALTAAAAASCASVAAALATEQAGTQATTSSTQGYYAPSDAEVAAAKERVAQLQQQAYAKNPKLAEIEQMLAENRAAWDRETEARAKALAEVRRLTPQFANAERDYYSMVTTWGYVTNVEWMKDAAKADIIRDVFTRSDEAVSRHLWFLKFAAPELKSADLRDKTAFWEAYRGWMVGHEEEVRGWAAATKVKGPFTPFPRFVREHAKIHGELKAQDEILRPYLQDHTPWELRQARKKAKRLEIASVTAKQYDVMLKRRTGRAERGSRE